VLILYNSHVKKGSGKGQRSRRSQALIFFVLVLCLHPASVFSCSSSASAKIKIVTSIFPLKEFAEAVCGDRGEASLLLPPGAEVHTWQPRASDIVRLASSDLFIYVGSNLEPWLDEMLEGISKPNFRTLEASRGLSLINKSAEKKDSAHPSAVDPHIWLDFSCDQIIVDRIRDRLTEIDPSHAVQYARNADLYKRRLQNLDEKFRVGLQNCGQRTFIFGGHEAFSYLARRYQLEQISLYGLSPDSEPTPKRVMEVVELAKKCKMKAIYFELFVSSKLAKMIAKEIGVKTLVLNPAHTLTKKQLMSGVTFFDIMEGNLKNLKDGLGCY
jgi:zinc transport system substrate-binding protein